MTELQHEKHFGPYHKYTYPEYLVILIILCIVAFGGFMLLMLRMNEAFFVQNDTVNTIFGFITFLGDELGFVILFSFIYFAFDKRFSRRLIWPFMISTHINTTLKVYWKDPRPPANWHYDPIEGSASGYGLPSGHTQGSVAFYGFGFHQFKGDKGKGKIAVRIVTFLLLILIPVSRLILGVHDVQDVLFGYLFGYAVLLLYFMVEPWLLSLKAKLPMYAKILFGVVFSAGLWVGSILLFPDEMYEFGLTCGIMLGFSIAFPLEEKFVKYDPVKLKTWLRLVYGLVGVVVTVAFYFGLDILFDLFTIESTAFILRPIKYFLLAVSISLGFPALLNLFTNFLDGKKVAVFKK